jgi:hypothetical protein
MAIYHFSMQMISRSKGQSVIASAAYRSGERLKDELTNETKYYKRKVKPEVMILAPSHSPEWVEDREKLWNEVEKSETRKNSQLAREINIALPVELSNHEQKNLIRDYIQNQFVDKGMIADIAIHRDDRANPHAHILLTTREISEEGFTVKNRDWNNRDLLNQWREQWAEYTNRALQEKGVQERISHLSHEARGLEILPTIHLGHVAHDMEEKGIQTDRGNINRERQEYNRLVVDLETYRKEKEALEQSIAKKQEDEKAKPFISSTERVYLQEAAKVLKSEPTLERIFERQQQLDQWEKRVDNNSQFIRWKDTAIREADSLYHSIHLAENRIKESEKLIENLNWIKVTHLKQNLRIKNKAEQDISEAKAQQGLYQQKLKYHQEKLKFQTEKEFHHIKIQHQEEFSKLLEKNRHTRGQINHERNILNKAETVLENAVIAKVANMYPERQEMRHLSYGAASMIDQLSRTNQNKIIPIETIEKTLQSRKTEVQNLHLALEHIEQDRSRLQRAKGYLKQYEEQQTIVENPYLKGKYTNQRISGSEKQKYEKALFIRNEYEQMLKTEGISGKDDFKEQVNTLGRMEAEIPKIKTQLNSHYHAISLLEGILNGIEQAGREMQKEPPVQRRKYKKQHQWELVR